MGRKTRAEVLAERAEQSAVEQKAMLIEEFPGIAHAVGLLDELGWNSFVADMAEEVWKLVLDADEPAETVLIDMTIPMINGWEIKFEINGTYIRISIYEPEKKFMMRLIDITTNTNSMEIGISDNAIPEEKGYTHSVTVWGLPQKKGE